jgi:hypothetical protein
MEKIYTIKQMEEKGYTDIIDGCSNMFIYLTENFGYTGINDTLDIGVFADNLGFLIIDNSVDYIYVRKNEKPPLRELKEEQFRLVFKSYLEHLNSCYKHNIPSVIVIPINIYTFYEKFWDNKSTNVVEENEEFIYLVQGESGSHEERQKRELYNGFNKEEAFEVARKGYNHTIFISFWINGKCVSEYFKEFWDTNGEGESWQRNIGKIVVELP